MRHACIIFHSFFWFLASLIIPSQGAILFASETYSTLNGDISLSVTIPDTTIDNDPSVSMILSGPSDYWFSIAFNATTMLQGSYSLQINNRNDRSNVIERYIDSKTQGTDLDTSISIDSYSIDSNTNIQTVTVIRNRIGLNSQYFTFPTTSASFAINVMYAVGEENDFGYHGFYNKGSSSLSFDFLPQLASPTSIPSLLPSLLPSLQPTHSPTTRVPTVAPSTREPTVSPITPFPTEFDANRTNSPSNLPTIMPTNIPSVFPTDLPSLAPTESYSTVRPTTREPTPKPTVAPTVTTTLIIASTTSRESSSSESDSMDIKTSIEGNIESTIENLNGKEAKTKKDDEEDLNTLELIVIIVVCVIMAVIFCFYCFVLLCKRNNNKNKANKNDTIDSIENEKKNRAETVKLKDTHTNWKRKNMSGKSQVSNVSFVARPISTDSNVTFETVNDENVSFINANGTAGNSNAQNRQNIVAMED